jgi:hypothetical protein
MMLAFTDSLLITTKADPEMVMLADSHYSRQKIGTPQFMPPGKTIVIRNSEGTLLFGWLWQQYRDDRESGYNCSIFRNESGRLCSEIILECEEIVIKCWGLNRFFTYVDPSEITSPNPGYCFKKAGWKFVRTVSDGKHLLAKEVSA